MPAASSQPSVRVNLLPMKESTCHGLIDSYKRTLELTELEERPQGEVDEDNINCKI